MEFKYGTSFLGDSPEAYERLLHDALRNEATLFTRADEVEAQWRIVQPILDAWQSGPGPSLYEAGEPGAARGRRVARRPRTNLEAGVRRAVPERSRWTGQDVHVEDVVGELDRLHRELQDVGRGQALARTLNLIIAPASSRAAKAVDDALAGLGGHSPSRTLVLRRHGSDRLNAEVVLEGELPDAAGRVGVCHDRATLTVSESRLEHAGSLLAPLLLSDLPTVLWLPEPGAPIPDPRLLERAQQVLVDSTADDGDALRRLEELTRRARVHDLAGAGWEFWRAATAAAFEPRERRALLPRIGRLDVHYEGDALSAGLLLAGWVAARAGWRPEALERDDGRARGKAVRPTAAPWRFR